MSIYNGLICPVCGKLFTEDDDVVTCPECGTPHHRECYVKTGECIHKGYHGPDYVYVRRKPSDDTTVQNDTSNSLETPIDSTFINSIVNESKDAKVDNIDGYKIKDVINAIGPNYVKFIEIFKKNKKFSWNWSAFFLGPFYLLYRKLIKEGALALFVQTMLIIITKYFFSDGIEKYSKIIENIATESSTSSEMYAKMVEQQSEISKVISSGGIDKFVLIIFCIILLINVASAIFANYMIKKKAYSVIDSVEEDLEDDESVFSINSFVKVRAEEDNSPKDMKTYFIRLKGGTSIFYPMMAYFIFEILLKLF